MNPSLQPLVAAALEAGATVLRCRGEGLSVSRKADHSPVTAADRGAEAIILGRLAQAFPGLAVVAEEEVAAGRVPHAGGQFFLVDPLDGTREFIEGKADFTVNIALMAAGRPLLGVVYAPAHGWLFAGDAAARRAWRAGVSPSVDQSGAGAIDAWREIRARSAPADGLVALVSRSHLSPDTRAYLQSLETGRRNIARTVNMGSSVKFCLLAAGEADLYPRFGPTMEWDTAAGHAVLAAAGGSVTTPDGAELRYGKPAFRNGAFIARGA
jgi:3'(2'), 5'-bisphosphate nucleotidase